jgi:hypothetical protein
LSANLTNSKRPLLGVIQSDVIFNWKSTKFCCIFLIKAVFSFLHPMGDKIKLNFFLILSRENGFCNFFIAVLGYIKIP